MKPARIEWAAWAANACSAPRPCMPQLSAARLVQRRTRDICDLARFAHVTDVTDPVTLIPSCAVTANARAHNETTAANDTRELGESVLISHPGDEQALDRMCDTMLDALEPLRASKRCLASVTIASPDVEILATLKIETDAGWAVLENASPPHFHALLLATNRAELESALCAVAQQHSLPRSRFRVSPVTGWASRWPHAVDPNVRDIIAYALCVGRRRDKRGHETPHQIDQWGAFDAVRLLADWALSVTQRRCACGCGATLTGRVDKRFASTRCRKRKSRATSKARRQSK